MRYAAISDIHGNFHALKAVIDDAKKHEADKFLFLGDYIGDFPYPNEVVELIEGLSSKEIIAGNKEEYLCNISKIPPESRTDRQFAPMYWNYDELTGENLSFLMNLPKRIDLEEIHMSHSSRDFFALPESGIMRSSVFFEKMTKHEFSHTDYLEMMKAYLSYEDEIMAAIKVLPKGIYVFGHSHLQWHAELDGRILVNPGSCGAPLDFDTAAPYTIIDVDNDGVKIEERRVEYDLNSAKESLLQSSLYSVAEVWGDIMISHLMTAKEKVNFFLEIVDSIAKERGETTPVSNETWEEAERKWREISASNHLYGVPRSSLSTLINL